MLNFIKNILIELLSVQIVKVRGRSMEPAISEGAWVVSFRAGFRHRDPERFDVVRLEESGTASSWIVKRIVGLPGEEVSLRAGELLINGEFVADSFAYCLDPQVGNFEWWLRDDEYVVLGDNRGASMDSRKFGVVKRGSFRGRVWV
ncbi:MAG TPA: signal peptidase I [Dehalococcoidia bacterium]|nr:signal peptidase I [Dehalococcoidia bacterium]